MKFGDKIKSFFLKKPVLSDGIFDDLCDLLIEGDFGAAGAVKIVDTLKERCKIEDNKDAPHILSELLLEELRKARPSVPVSAQDKLVIILLLGVNGTGKTTSAAKLCSFFGTEFGKRSVLAAADTFRAAAIDQLKIHGKNLNARVVAHKQGGDPAAVVYDALEAAVSGGADIVIADTAGRMHTKNSLVEELRKIDRVVEAKAGPLVKAGEARYLKYLVLDATTGRNAFAQSEIFNEAVNLDGVILTKFDSTAKGGVVFSLASELGLPVVYICSGEKYGDIEIFSPEKFAKEFTGIE